MSNDNITLDFGDMSILPKIQLSQRHVVSVYFNKNVSMERKPEKDSAYFPANRMNLYTLIPVVLFILAIKYLAVPVVFVSTSGSSQLPVYIGSILAYCIMLIWFFWQIRTNKIDPDLIYARQKRKIPFLSLFTFQISDFFFFVLFFMFLNALASSDGFMRIFERIGDTELAVWSVSNMLFAPVAEEILFRLVFLNRIKIRYGIPKAILFSSVLFALIHVGNGWENMLHALFLGFFYSIIYEYTGSLRASTLMHVLNNSILIFLVLLMKKTPALFNINVHYAKISIFLAIAGIAYITWFFSYYIRALVKVNKTCTQAGNGTEQT